MLHEIPCPTTLSAPLKEFLHALDIGGFVGDISTEFADRVVASTDNSIWQRTPEAVLSPRTHEDIVFVLKLLGQESFRNINITARGAGTSTAGQTLTHEVVLDCKRYMNEIIAYNETLKQVTVEPGAVLATVNRALQEYGVMIGPTVATATRATIGGMIGNDSAGKGSAIYGKMSDCIVEMQTVLVGGKTISTKTLSPSETDKLEQRVDFYGLLLRGLRDACDLAQPYYPKHWPTIPRFVSGYNLPMAWDGETCDPNRILCGAEGTLGVTTSATLQCVDIPQQRELLILGFASFDDALVHGNSLREFQPSAIECVDGMVLDSARNDNCWESVKELLGKHSTEIRSLLFVEFVGVSSRIQEAFAFAKNHSNAVHLFRTDDEILMNAAWSFRSKSVGLLSATKGEKQPVPFVEDCAVPPESLARFIKDFRSILNAHGLQAGMFGHVDAGVIHVRPALNMKSPKDRALVQRITNEVASLVKSYGGVLWGEHGKGFRSEFGPSIFGDGIWKQICAVKKLFDPYNQLNPGKVAVPDINMALRGIDEDTRGRHDEAITALPILESVTRCDGNSECQSAEFESHMCPTYRATGDPKHSPRGRAELIRDWLGRLHTKELRGGNFLQKLFASRSNDDFSHEVFEALEGCLSCKACANDCPMQIDIPSVRSEFYAIYFGRYFRPVRDHLWCNMERMLPFMSSTFGKLLPTAFFASLVGIVDAPTPTRKLSLQSYTPSQAIQRQASVVILQDTFTTYFRHEVIVALQRILTHLGHSVAIIECRPNGKAMHVRGKLSAFDSLAQKNTRWLTPLHQANIPIVGIDPAATLLWRDEYKKCTGVEIPVLLPQEFLLEQELTSITCRGTWELLPHCIEYAVARQSQNQWKQIFDRIGATLELKEAACCGMGGMFGHQQEFKDQSLHIWRQNWAPHNPDNSKTLATGFSCFSQAKRAENLRLLHPLEVISNQIVLESPLLGEDQVRV